MHKLPLLTAFIIAACLLSYTIAPAATPIVLTPAEEAALAKEPPLAQADVDAFIAYGPALIKAFNLNDAQTAETVLNRTGWSKTRSSYVISKISYGYAVAIQPRAAKTMLESAGIPAVLMPSATELELIKQNMPALDEIFGALTSR